MVKRLCFFFLFLLLIEVEKLYPYYWIYAPIESENDVERLYEKGKIEYTEYNMLLELFRDKIDINNADEETLFLVPGITEKDIVKIKKYREKHFFKDIKELKKVIGEDSYKASNRFFYVSAKVKYNLNDRCYLYGSDYQTIFRNNFYSDYVNIYSDIRRKYRSYAERNGDFVFKKDSDYKFKPERTTCYFKLKNFSFILGDYEIKGIFLLGGGSKESSWLSITKNFGYTEKMKGIASIFDYDNWKILTFYSGFKKDGSVIAYDKKKKEYESAFLYDLYWQETKGTVIRYQKRKYGLSLGYMNYFDKEPNYFKDEHLFFFSSFAVPFYFTKIFFDFVENKEKDLAFRVSFSNRGEHNRFFTTFYKNTGVFLPFANSEYASSKKGFEFSDKGRYGKLSYYALLKNFTKSDDSSSLYYFGKLSYEIFENFSPFIEIGKYSSDQYNGMGIFYGSYSNSYKLSFRKYESGKTSFYFRKKFSKKGYFLLGEIYYNYKNGKSVEKIANGSLNIFLNNMFTFRYLLHLRWYGKSEYSSSYFYFSLEI